MRLPLIFFGLLTASLASLGGAARSPKRGLAFVPNESYPNDNAIWVRPNGGLTWYYNFQSNVSVAYASLPQTTIEFVPTMWGAGGGSGNDPSFLDGIVTATTTKGRNISHVLTFNSPDKSFADGGSDMSPATAAAVWASNILPLREKHGVKVGLPTVEDPHDWLDSFLKSCARINDGKECGFDFVPVYSHGDLSVLKGRVDAFATAYPTSPIWVMGYGFENQDLPTTQAFFNSSVAYLDAHQKVERYSWFGAFRSIVSSSAVGPSQAMLDPWGNLTDIGSWYLGGGATGNPPPCAGGGKTSGAAGSLVVERTMVPPAATRNIGSADR
ncbi:glycosyl hydrolase catalytic core-domain-containing protein [Podospora didyma]|uniref:Glycosyl hydrolase catalytic core-domain-containing protein n=1 Tax=Podospora didyma TaxID=330526 RepID=A0AAE0U5G3_9PEZI|nr:glycosyl hydrolase catalytic core-domain-containing protein [Podospora didyma]